MKRFTETKKWSDPWFRKLDPKFKAFWLYLVDSCDVAGVWDTDLELASFQIGVSFEENELLEILKERVSKLDNDKWFIVKFVEFQYGVLNPENNCHKGVIRSLELNKIDLNKPLIRPLLGPKEEDKVKETVKRKAGESEGIVWPECLLTPEFKTVWARWERHRIEIRKKLTREMTIASLQKLSTFGVTRAVQIVEFTLEKGWQGLAYDFDAGFSKPVSPAKQLTSGSEPVWIPKT